MAPGGVVGGWFSAGPDGLADVVNLGPPTSDEFEHGAELAEGGDDGGFGGILDQFDLFSRRPGGRYNT